MPEQTKEFLKIYAKLTSYCAYQDRCEQEVWQKLQGFEVGETEKEQLISLLKEEEFLDEKRFAESFVRGKFYYKKWGKIKIKHGLSQKNIPKNISEKAFSQIDEEDYYQCLKKLLSDKNEALHKEKDPYQKKAKLLRFAASKGYEPFLIHEILNEIP